MSKGTDRKPPQKQSGDVSVTPVTPVQNPDSLPKVNEHHLVLEMTKSWSGPLPPPEFGERYEVIHPGAVDRLFTMAEKQSEHRQAMEKLSVEAQIKDLTAEREERRRGQYLGFGVAIAFIVAGSLAIVYGTMATQVVGGLFGGGGAIGLVSLFVLGRDKKSDPAVPPKKATEHIPQANTGPKEK